MVRTDCSAPPTSAWPPDGLLLHLAQLARDVGRGGVERLQLRRIDLDAHLARNAAHARHRAEAAHAEQRLGDVVVDEPAQRLAVHARGGDGVGEDRRARDVELADRRVAHVGGQVGAHARDGVAHVVDRLLRRLLEAELDRDDGRAVEHLGVDVLDALQRRDRVLELARHLGLELRGRGAGQRRGDGDGGQVDAREVLDLHRP